MAVVPAAEQFVGLRYFAPISVDDLVRYRKARLGVGRDIQAS